MSPAKIVAFFLANNGFGVMPPTSPGIDWPVFESNMPNQFSRAICCYDVNGRPHGRCGRLGTPVDHWGVQIRVRAEENSVGYEKAQELIEAVAAVLRTSVDVGLPDPVIIQSITRTSVIIPLGTEQDGKRTVHMFNTLVSLATTPTTPLTFPQGSPVDFLELVP